MSYSIQEAKYEFEEAVAEAIKKGDGDKLYALATQLEEDEAQPLLAIIAKWKKEDDDDWAYDRWVDNNM